MQCPAPFALTTYDKLNAGRGEWYGKFHPDQVLAARDAVKHWASLLPSTGDDR